MGRFILSGCIELLSDNEPKSFTAQARECLTIFNQKEKEKEPTTIIPIQPAYIAEQLSLF